MGTDSMILADGAIPAPAKFHYHSKRLFYLYACGVRRIIQSSFGIHETGNHQIID